MRALATARARLMLCARVAVLRADGVDVAYVHSFARSTCASTALTALDACRRHSCSAALNAHHVP